MCNCLKPRDEVMNLATLMEEKLREHDEEWNGEAWKRDTLHDIWTSANDKIDKLSVRMFLEEQSHGEIKKLCVHIANYMMMMVDIINEKHS